MLIHLRLRYWNNLAPLANLPKLKDLAILRMLDFIKINTGKIAHLLVYTLTTLINYFVFLQVHYNRYFNLRLKMAFIKIAHITNQVRP
jgi:hypothetical protein